MIFNALRFEELNYLAQVSINPLFVQDSRDSQFISRLVPSLSCLLRVVGIERDGISSFCNLPEHKRTQGCHTNPLFLAKDRINNYTLTTRGSLLLKVNRATCHSCGEVKLNCATDWNEHNLCIQCIKSNVSPPYNFGEGKGRCCTQYGCGQNEQLVVYRHAVDIVREFKKRRN